MEKKVRVTKEIEFESCHKLSNYVGPCANLHGHSYKMQVTIEGSPLRLQMNNGMLVDFKNLKKIIKERIVDEWDHAYLNDKVTFQPTAENMVIFAADEIQKGITAEYPGLIVRSVKLWETSTSFAEVVIND